MNLRESIFEVLSCFVTKSFPSKSIENGVSKRQIVCVTHLRHPPSSVTYYLNDP